MSLCRSLLPAAALLAFCLATPAAAAPEPRIVNGTLAAQGEYPAQGYLGVDTDLNGEINFACGGTLVGSRQFLTAAHCLITAGGLPLPPASFNVRLGDVDLADPTADTYEVTAVERHRDFVRVPRRNDVAMLTLDRAADYQLYEPMRVVDDSEDASWAPGTSARVLGWGQLSDGGPPSDLLRKADVPIEIPDRCANAYGDQFDAGIMVCAAPDPDTDPADAQDVCVGDGGGPLLVPDGAFFVLAGVAARDAGCGDPDEPGVYTRVGDNVTDDDDGLNNWVHGRTPEADFEFDHAPRANEPVKLTSTSNYPPGGPAGDDYFDTLKWDLDNDGAFDDASGRSVSHKYPAAGEQVTGLEVSNAAEGDRAIVYYRFDVGQDPSLNPPASLVPPALTPIPPAVSPKRAGFLATIRSAKRPKVRRGRFNISVRFARTAPAGIAVVEVYRGKRKIGIARGRVRRGGVRRISVKLTPTGRRLLARSATKRLKLRVRVRVGRRVLRSKTLTVRR